MSSLGFQRARKPEEIEQRREAILAAAAELFDAEGPQGAGLNAIAAKAGFTKSNVYRYFESREQVLLSLLFAELERFVPAFEAASAECAIGDIDALARVTAECFLAQPRFCALISILAGVLEQNVSEQSIIDLKRSMSGLNDRLSTALHARLPGATLADCGWVIAIVGALVGGIWPNANPASAAARVLTMPEFRHMKPSLERDLERTIRALLREIVGN